MFTRTTRRKTRRGSALMAIAYLGLVMSAVVGVYFYRTSQTASGESRVRENVDGAQAAAEYAVELAANNLTKMEYLTSAEGKRLSVVADWVGSNPYGSTGRENAERRIGGKIDQYDYRVQVRAVREARELTGADAMPSAWLSNIDPGAYNYGVDPVRAFSGAYEIIATARNRAATITPMLAHDTSVRTVVNLSYNSLGNSLDKLAILTLRHPSGLSEESVAVQVGGEDHYAVKAAVKDPTGEGEVIEGLANIKATPSELYSVTNDFWSQGKMTLHYRNEAEINPMVPWTIGFDDTYPGRNFLGKNQDMILYDPARPVDQYVFGGKIAGSDFTLSDPNTGSALMYRRGRSVTLDDNNRIRETRESQSHPGQMTTSTLAVGKVENILKLYLNFINPVGSANHPAANATESEVRSWVSSRWSQQSLGYHSKAMTKNRDTSVGRAQRPLDNADSTARRRWATLIWIKNSNGQFLVRDYPDDNYAQPNKPTSNPPNEWYGTYRWAWYGGYYGDDKYHYGSWINPKTYAIGNSRNHRKHLNTRFLTIEELLGEQVTKGSDGLPAKLDGLNNVTPGVPDFKLDASGNRIPYKPDAGSDTIFDEHYQRTNRGDNWGVNSNTLAKMPPTDGIYVLVEDPAESHDWTNHRGQRYKRYQTLQDFAFDREIADVEHGEESDIRSMTSLHMVLEITPEENSPTNEGMYFDMGLTVTLVHPKKISISKGDDDFLADLFRQWWEGERQESLTGKLSHAAISAIMEKAENLSLDETLKAWFRQFGFYQGNENASLADVDTMVDADRKKTTFGRAYFSSDGMLLNPSPEYNVYFYGRDNLHDYYYFFQSLFTFAKFQAAMEAAGQWSLLVSDEALMKVRLAEWREETAVAHMELLNPGKTFKPIETRFDSPDRNRLDFSMENMSELFKLAEDDLTPRAIAAEAMGFKNQRAPAAYARKAADGTISWIQTYSQLNPTGSMEEIPFVKKILPFLPGEILIDEEQSHLAGLVVSGMPQHVPMLFRNNGSKQYNGRLLKSTFVWDTMTAPDDITLTSMHDWPQWFLGNDPENIVTRSLKEPLLEKYPKEHRGHLGWHREGPVPTPPENTGTVTKDEYKIMYGDHYEYVILGQRGFIPYETVQADGKKYIAVLRPDTPDDVELEDCAPRLLPPESMPNITVQGKEIDGAGILIVNGNLDLRTRLAFHGVLVVLGDLTVTPEKDYLLNENDNPYDKDGNELSWDGSHWYYLDANGAKVVSYRMFEWRGELVVQGKVLVGGEIKITPETNMGEEMRPAGIVDIRGSRQAVNETVDVWLDVAPNEGFTSERLGWSSNSGAVTGRDLWKE